MILVTPDLSAMRRQFGARATRPTATRQSRKGAISSWERGQGQCAVVRVGGMWNRVPAGKPSRLRRKEYRPSRPMAAGSWRRARLGSLRAITGVQEVSPGGTCRESR